MKKILIPTVLCTALLPSATTLWAQSTADSTDRLSLSYRMAFNLGVKFNSVAGFAAQTDPGSASGGRDPRHYDDGYNLVDNNNNTYPGYDPLTRNWSYQSPDQVLNGQFIVMHSSAAAPVAATSTADGDPSHGFEIAYQHEFARNDAWSWGVEACFNYMKVCVGDSLAYSAPVSRINDAFEVPADSESGFRYIPSAPYAGGNFGGPLLGSAPTRSTTLIPNGAAIISRHDFDADLFGFKLGAYLDIPLDEKWRLTFSGGLALVQVDSTFNYRDVVSIPDVGSQTYVGRSSHDTLLVGGYITGAVSYALDKDWTLFANAQWQDVGLYTHAVGTASAQLDLSQTIFVAFGATWSF